MSNDIHDTSYDTLKVLNYIVNNDTICTSEIASILQSAKSERSNLRHFKTIRAFFKNELGIEVFERTGRGCYQIINKSILQQALNLGDKKELLSYMQILKEVLPHYYETLDDNMKKKISRAEKDADLAYIFHNNPMEDFKNNHALQDVEKAVKLQRKSEFVYRGITYKEVRPLNIIFMEGNLYLACVTEDEFAGGFKFLRIHLIEDFQMSVNEFNETEKVIEVRRFLQEFQTPFAVFQGDYQKVILEASPSVSKHFLQKKHLPSQEEKLLDDGKLLLTFYVTDYMEISPMIKKWMPHLRLIEPVEWKDQLSKELQLYLVELTNSGIYNECK
ncbi:MAG TPA: WYL domain-containing protein [Arcobacter sp.]|nr:WYL domain-containing protein [Arcobacter sp.]